MLDRQAKRLSRRSAENNKQISRSAQHHISSDSSIVKKCMDPAYLREIDSFMTKEMGDDDDDTINSYYASRFVQSDTDMTYPTTGESNSQDTEESDWTKMTTDTQSTQKTGFSYAQSKHDHAPKNYHSIPVSSPYVPSPTDSERAVRSSSMQTEQSTQQSFGETTYNAAFDYIRKTQLQFSQSNKDPPSDKSVATSRSIRAEDAGSAILKGRRVVRQKKNELASQIIKRRQLAIIQAGEEP